MHLHTGNKRTSTKEVLANRSRVDHQKKILPPPQFCKFGDFHIFNFWSRWILRKFEILGIIVNEFVSFSFYIFPFLLKECDIIFVPLEGFRLSVDHIETNIVQVMIKYSCTNNSNSSSVFVPVTNFFSLL